VIHEIHEHGVDPAALGLHPAPGDGRNLPASDATLTPCDLMGLPVTKPQWDPN